MRTERFIIFVLRITSEPRVKFVDRKRSLNPKVVYATDHSKAVVPVSSGWLCGLYYGALHVKSCLALCPRVSSVLLAL